MARIAYFGAWNHLQVVKDLLSRGVKEFVCIDTQPRSECDGLTFDPEMYREGFYKELLESCKRFGFQHIASTVLDTGYGAKIGYDGSGGYEHICPTLLKFRNAETDQTLHYYISTNILYNMCAPLVEDLRGCDGLILSGYFPEKRILDYLPADVEFYCYSNTVYRRDEGTIGTVLDVLDRGIFHLIDFESGRFLSTYSSIHELK